MEELHALEDEALQALARSGNAVAEEVLVKRFARVVKMRARPLFLVGGDSEDLTQEGMLGLLSAIRTYDPQVGVLFRTYAEICIRRRLHSAIATAARYKHSPLNQAISFESAQFDETQTWSDTRDLEEQILTEEQTTEILCRYRHLLSGFECEILALFLEGFSYQEMAERVRKPVKSVDNAVSRIRKKLANSINSGENSSG